MPLTDMQMRKAETRDKPYTLSDGGGLRALVSTSGSKTWQFLYRFDGQQRTLVLGKYPDMPLAKARTARDVAKGLIANGTDPAGGIGKPSKRKLDAGERTFRQVAEEFHQIWQSGKNKAHIDRVWARLERDAFPLIGDRPLTDIKPAEIVAMIRLVEDRGALDVSRRLKQKCGEVFGYAIAMGYAESDPTARVNKALRPKPKVEHMPRVPVKDMPKLLRAIDGYRISDMARLGMQYTLLTATRTGEVREAQWSEIEGDIWRIPGSRMKMGREHIVPLSRQTLELLKEIETHKRNEYLFPGPRRPMMNSNFMINALYDLDMRGVQTVHGFRSLFSTYLNESGQFNRDWIELQLAHAEEDEIRASYNAAEYLPQRVKMMQWWADELDRMRGKPVASENADDFDELLRH